MIDESAITHLEKVLSLLSDNLERTEGAKDKLLEELLIKGRPMLYRTIPLCRREIRVTGAGRRTEIF